MHPLCLPSLRKGYAAINIFSKPKDKTPPRAKRVRRRNKSIYAMPAVVLFYPRPLQAGTDGAGSQNPGPGATP